MKIRKFISAVLVCSMLLAALGSLSYSSAANTTNILLMDSENACDIVKVYSEKMTMGDVNGDGKINAMDSFELKKYIVGLSANAQRFTIDVDGDGKRNSLDLFRLKLIIMQKIVATEMDNTTVVKAYDADYSALKLTVTDAGSTDAFFDIDMSEIDLGNYGYITVVWSGNDKAEIGFVDGYHYTQYSEDVTLVGDGEYTYATAAIPENCKRSNCIEIKYSSPADDGELIIDSIILSATEDEANAAASERLALRNKAKEYKYVSINFDSAESLSMLSASASTMMSYDETNASVRLIAPMAGTDYNVTVDLESYGISADEYKYIVYTSKAPQRDGVTPAGEINFCVGNVTEETAGYSCMFSNIDNEAFHSSIFEMTNADFWTGTVHSLKIDYFNETADFGYLHYLKSIVFCDSYEAAQAICVDREVTTPDVRQLFNYGLYTKGEMRMAYRMYVPYDYDGYKKYPVLTFLHGAGQRGDDGLQQVESVVPQFFDDPATDVAYNSIVIVPQCPYKYRWVESDWGLGFYYLDETEESEPMKAYINVLENVKQTYRVDTDRFYITGISMGGYGSWDLLMRHGDMFAAGMPICGGADRKKADLLVDIPIRTFHGTDDTDVPVTGTRRIYNAIIDAGGTKISFTELEGYTHDVWTVTYNDSSNMDWLFSQRLSDRTH